MRNKSTGRTNGLILTTISHEDTDARFLTSFFHEDAVEERTAGSRARAGKLTKA